ncbi:MAG: NADPH-dependent 7-cyano-7-deazaguanine reductase QueF [Glaciecola sp.]
MDHLTLGKVTEYSQHYDPTLLQGVPRALSRDAIKLPTNLPFSGTDMWNAYEVSWLNNKGKPLVAILQCRVPITSPNLIESKSFKLYLNSLNQSTFVNEDAVVALLEKDLSACAGEAVNVNLILSHQFAELNIGDLPGKVLDNLDVEIDDYELCPSSLITTSDNTSECLVSHLLKSNCLITNQPDWGSVLIKYTGPKIDHQALLKYLISFRQHNEFHEQCVERIYYDILQYCKPTKLTVYARYTRRGGLDINPFRSNFEAPYADTRLARQ